MYQFLTVPASDVQVGDIVVSASLSLRVVSVYRGMGAYKSDIAIGLVAEGAQSYEALNWYPDSTEFLIKRKV